MLAFRNIGLKMLLRFAGKVISFSLAVPGCKLYIRETFKAISQLSRSSRPFACIDGDLRAEILYWRFLDEWKDCLPWRSEHHLTVSLYSDASSRSWGAVLIQDSQRLVSRDYWSVDSSEDINVFESKALLNALVAFRARLSNSMVDVHIDSRVHKSALDSDGGKNSAINDVVRIFSVIVVILILASRLSMFLPAETQQMNLHGIYRTLIVCSPPRHGCAWSVVSALIPLI